MKFTSFRNKCQADTFAECIRDVKSIKFAEVEQDSDGRWTVIWQIV